ncbi:MAG TPA: peptidyl-prolyl cis-trans isomerase [Candidatus Limnocylindria bacterium]|jgi:parvulin-like peptidyl-prolyl isomerase|nr:peptidyl-prolyl cis-trans isomerase [Candidatus Limnocylindria bacterium]
MSEGSKYAVRRRAALTLFTIVLGLLIGAGCSRRAEPDPEVVAKMGAQEIRVAEFQAWAQRRASANDAKAKEALLEEMLDHAALLQQARAAGLDKDPELRRSWENMLVAKLRESQLESRITNAQPTEAQIQSYYASHPAQYTEPAMRRGAVLFLEYPKKALPERLAKVRQRLSEARTQALGQATNDPAARGFGALAIEYSEDQATRYRGGDMGWVQAGRQDARFDPRVLETLFAMSQPGEVSDVLETSRGCYLVKFLETRAERLKPLADVEPAIRHLLLMENRKRMEIEWKQSARAVLPTQIFPEVMERVKLPPQTPAAAQPPGLP